MLKFNAAAFYTVSTNLQEFQTLTNYGGGGQGSNADVILNDSNRKHLETLTDDLERHLQVLGARVAVMGCRRLRAVIRDPAATWRKVADRIEHIDLRLTDELGGKYLLVLEEKEEALFNPTSPLFGEDFANKFATAGIYELDEAAKCLALGRSTASVFHLMRVMEIGIQVVADCLGAPPPLKDAERNWGRILEKIKDAMDARNTAKPPNWRKGEEKAFFAEAYASLDAVRVAWRNPTMHVTNKYTDSEAELVFVAVKGFMMKLASRCDENGEPKA